MARPPRDTAAGIFHVTGHSVWTAPLFRDDVDRVEYLRQLARTTTEFKWTCLSYCLLTNHVHLLLEVGKGALPAGMQQLHTTYACRYNQRHELRGHVFGARYGASRIDTDAYLLAAFAYVARNPVEAGLCASPAAWPWSSYPATLGLREPTSFVRHERLLSLLSSRREVALRRLRTLVEAA
jgi:putative transposase